nr:Chain UG, UnkG [Trypanosoma brucei brucei]
AAAAAAETDWKVIAA